ncbi:MAG: CotH kinase family protein, partial [Planctomycetes bacterium]|nr:CotH kinase family protein [Planctomycetota bacterium]
CVRGARGDAVGDIVITEIMYNPDGNDAGREFLEIFNRSATESHDLGGFRFTRGITFTFPPVIIGPGEYLVVCADEQLIRRQYGITNTVGNWSPDKVLANSGERIQLVDAGSPPAEIEDLAYDDARPWPVAADGFGASLERVSPFHDSADPANWVPGKPAGEWLSVEATGIAGSSRLYLYLLGPGVAYVDDLRLVAEGRPEENCVANGDFESGRLAPWRAEGNHGGSRVSRLRAYSGASSLELSASDAGGVPADGVSQHGLALEPGDRCTLRLRAFLPEPGQVLVARLFSSGTAEPIRLEIADRSATPGHANRALASNPPPRIYPVAHRPQVVRTSDVVFVIAELWDEDGVEEGAVHWDEGAGEQTAALRDDGSHEDGLAGDGVWGARLGSFPPGSLVRYRVTARDSRGEVARFPREGEPGGSLGLYVEPDEDPPAFPLRASTGAVSDRSPVYHLLIDPAQLEGSPPHLKGDPLLYRPAVFVHDGVVHDVDVRHHGQISIQADKKKWRIRLADGGCFAPPFADREPVGIFNVDGSYADKTFLREWLSYRAFDEAGVPAPELWHVRLYVNGVHRGLYLHVEDISQPEWLSRNNLDDDGWLWKAYSNARYRRDELYELKVDEDRNPTAAFEVLGCFLESINGLEGDALTRYLRTHVDVETFTSYLAVEQLIHDGDSLNNNYFLFAEQDAPAGSWMFFPWDKDLTHGRDFECRPVSADDPGILHAGGDGLYNDTIRIDLFGDPDLLFGTSVRPLCAGDLWNGLIDAFLVRGDGFRGPYYERVADLLFRLYHPDRLLPLIEEMAAVLESEVERDWDLNPPYGVRRPYREEVSMLEAYVRGRYAYLAAAIDAHSVARLGRLTCRREGGNAILGWPPAEWDGTITVSRDDQLLETLPVTATSVIAPLNTTLETNVFTVALRVEGMERENRSCTMSTGPVPPVVAAFTASSREATAPATIGFNNLSSGAERFLWSFGDGETSDEADPVHVYRDPGRYRVVLEAIGDGGVSVQEQPAFVVVRPPLFAGFEAIPDAGQAPFRVEFLNHSTGSDDFLWDFGDGSGSSAANPTHYYSSAGTYQVALRALGPQADAVAVGTVLAEDDLDADFIGTPRYGVAPIEVEFADASAGPVLTWRWELGDGATSDLPSLSHVYATPGVYTVTLEVRGQVSLGRRTREAYIMVGDRDELFVRGEVNGDGERDISDAVTILRFLFTGTAVVGCLDAADADDSGEVDISDAVTLLGHLFLDGRPLPFPCEAPGVDPTPDALDCAEARSEGDGGRHDG